MNKFILSLLYLLIFNSTIHAEPLKIHCSPELQSCIQAILQIPEARTLMEQIQAEGQIQIVAHNTALSNKFGAFWDSDRRTICIAHSPNCSEGSLIGSILFEMHNASVNRQINHFNDLANKRQIDKENYIQAMEYLEYINSLNAAKLATKGIKMGLLPRDARLPTYSSFEEHFRAQRMSGHSDCFGHNYEMSL